MTPVYATKGGGNNYPVGVNTLLSGVQPAPGNHVYVYLQENTKRPRSMAIAAARRAACRTSRCTRRWRRSGSPHVWRDVTFLGATIESRTNVPFVDLNLHFDAHTPKGNVYKSGTATGLSDLTVGPLFLGWHTGTLHQMVGVDFFLPTGSYDASRLVNPGRHYYSMAPNYAVTWLPTPKVEFSARALYSLNSVNHVTDYHSGNEFIVDYSAGYRIIPMWQLGANGYFYRQTTNDIQNGLLVDGNGNRGQVLAVGPSIVYGNRKFSVVFKYQREMLVRNRPEGNRF